VAWVDVQRNRAATNQIYRATYDKGTSIGDPLTQMYWFKSKSTTPFRR
jgi:hypothetical protein